MPGGRVLGRGGLLLALVLFGCDGGAGSQWRSPNGEATDAGADVRTEASDVADVATHSVIGRWQAIYVTSRDESRQPLDLRQTPFTVFAVRPDGQFSSHPGGGDNTGSFSIPKVPRFPYWLNVSDRFLSGGAPGQVFDLVETVLGRASAMRAPAGTILRLMLRGFAPLQLQDRVYLFSPSAGTYLADLSAAGGSRPAAGVTSLDIQVDISRFERANLIEGTASGDETYVVHLVAYPLSRSLLVAQQALHTGSLQMTPGGLATLEGMLADTASRESATVIWQRRELASVASRSAPKAEVSWHELQLSTSPGTRRHGDFSFAGLLFQWDLVHEDQSSADQLVEIDWRNPFPAQWGRLLSYRTSFDASLMLTSNMHWVLSGSIGGSELIEPGATVAVGPKVGPPREIRIDGRQPGAAADGVGLHPVLSWLAPAFGTANGYKLDVFLRLDDTPDSLAVHRGTMVVDGTEARLPPGLIEPGRWAAAVVRAVSNELFGPRSLGRKMPGTAYADAVSPPFRP